jgi:VIT1/CCC1 family predicted Fe2+/Mn2+ transporter
MVRARVILAIVLVALGLVWIGQGTGVLRGSSFMDDDLRWALIGAGCVVVGLVIGWLEVRRRRTA